MLQEKALITVLSLTFAALALPGAARAQFVEQGKKLVGSGGVANQGLAVALSADGNTALIGGGGEASVGAVWVFTRSGGAWTQQGSKLVGTGAAFPAFPRQGQSVALSADGNTALVGGPGDNANFGAVWVFTRSGGVWTQQGNKLVGSGVGPLAGQGQSVALSADRLVTTPKGHRCRRRRAVRPPGCGCRSSRRPPWPRRPCATRFPAARRVATS